MEQIVAFYRANLKPLVNQVFPDDPEASSTLYMTGAAAIIVTAIIWRSLGLSSSKRTKRQQTKKKERTKRNKDIKPEPLTHEKRIESVRLRFNDEYKPGITSLLENYDPADKDKVYQRNYYNEMLLKLLIELDGVDLGEIQGERKVALKEQRKGVIREIQAHLKTLDKLI